MGARTHAAAASSTRARLPTSPARSLGSRRSQANMSYAPCFMPAYHEAFAYASEAAEGQYSSCGTPGGDRQSCSGRV